MKANIIGQTVPIKQFIYTEKKIKKHSDSSTNTVPIKTILQKMGMINLQEKDLDRNRLLSSPQQHLITTKQIKRKSSLSYKKFLTPRDQTYQPKPIMFDRFNYENYHNYTYRNPFKPSKFQPQNMAIKSVPKDVKKGTSKNIEIVLCQNKFQQFVQQTNKKIQKFYQEKVQKQHHKKQTPQFRRTLPNYVSQRSQADSLPHSQRKSNVKLYRTQKLISYSSSLNKSVRTTLAKCMKQFQTLQKLSKFMQTQQKLNERYLLDKPQKDASKTVLLDIITHRFPFLKNLSKKIRNNLYKSLLGTDKIHPFTKINIHQYIRFVQLFIQRDANVQDKTFFIFNFLFRQGSQLTYQCAERVISELGKPMNLLNEILITLAVIMQQQKDNEEKIFRALLDNCNFLDTIISLIIDK